MDYTVSSEEVHFSSGAPDGTESCINISAICDSSQEGDETLTIFIGGTTQYSVETTGSEYSSFIQIIIMENTGIHIIKLVSLPFLCMNACMNQV